VWDGKEEFIDGTLEFDGFLSERGEKGVPEGCDDVIKCNRVCSALLELCAGG